MAYIFFDASITSIESIAIVSSFSFSAVLTLFVAEDLKLDHSIMFSVLFYRIANLLMVERSGSIINFQ
jgi:hypothetical protein